MADTVEQGLEALQKLEGDLKTKQEEFDKLKTLTAEEQSKKAALEQELSRVQKQIDESRESKRKEESSFTGQLRDENLEKAKQRIIKDMGYEGKPEAIKALEDTFAKLDSKAITEDKIYDDLLSAHAVLNRARYANIEKTMKEQQQEADRLKEIMSSGVSLGNQPTPIESVTLSPEDIAAAKWAGIPIEKYKELRSRGKV